MQEIVKPYGVEAGFVTGAVGKFGLAIMLPLSYSLSVTTSLFMTKNTCFNSRALSSFG